MQNELVDPLEALGMPIEYNYKEWQLIRGVLARLSGLLRERKVEIIKQRIFSWAFLEEEQ